MSYSLHVMACFCSQRNVQRLDGHGSGPRGARAFGLGSPGDVALLQSGVPSHGLWSFHLGIFLGKNIRDICRDFF